MRDTWPSELWRWNSPWQDHLFMCFVLNMLVRLSYSLCCRDVSRPCCSFSARLRKMSKSLSLYIRVWQALSFSRTLILHSSCTVWSINLEIPCWCNSVIEPFWHIRHVITIWHEYNGLDRMFSDASREWTVQNTVYFFQFGFFGAEHTFFFISFVFFFVGFKHLDLWLKYDSIK